MKLTRRSFNKVALMPLIPTGAAARQGPTSTVGFGPLRRDRNKLLDLPKGFKYRVISKVGQKMSDGFYVPGFFDGMGTFPGPEGTTIILRNHEIRLGNPPSLGPFRGEKGLRGQFPVEYVYDPGAEGDYCLGSVTTIVFDTSEQKTRRQFLNLVGTLTNCSGGVTPWGSWITCEESVENQGELTSRTHGYAFEVPVTEFPDLKKPTPLKGLGRFTHEGVVFSQPGIAYLTEDRPNGLFYRFLPNEKGRLEGGGKLQCLMLRDCPKCDTRNWNARTIEPFEEFTVVWVDLTETDPPHDNLRYRGIRDGAAFFARGEGICLLGQGIYFVATTGGKKGLGQIWLYTPSPWEGTPREEEQPGTLQLIS